MSSSMWAWRIIFPGGGLIACLVVLWASIHPQGPSRGDGDGKNPGPEGSATAMTGRIVAEGRLVARPGAEITVGTEAGGLIVELRVSEKARVRKGDLLVRFQSADREAAVAIAEARLAEADSELEFQKREFKRRAQAPLDTKNFSSEVDASRRDYEVAAARRKAAAASLEQAKFATAQSRVASPIDGVVIACHVQAGEIAAPGGRLVTVCDLSRTRVEAEFDEFDAQKVALGSDVTIRAEGQGEVSWRGTVEEIPDRLSSRTIAPTDPGRPTDTGVLLVKIAPDDPIPLKLGQQVEVEWVPPPPVEATNPPPIGAKPEGVSAARSNQTKFNTP